MNVPALVLGLVLGTMLAAALHLLRGGSLRVLAMIWLAVQSGFWLAQLAAPLVPDPLWRIGDLHVATGLAGALLAALVTNTVASRRHRKHP